MDYKKIKLIEPIHELQEDETPKQHYFVDLYYDVEDDNLTNFYESFDGLDKGDKWVYSGCEEILKFKPYSQSTFRNLVYCLQFKKRRKSCFKDIYQSKQESRRKKVVDFMDTFIDDVIESTNDLKGTENEINMDGFTRPHLKAKGKNNVSSARKTNWEILKDLGNIEEPSKNINVNNDVTFTDKSNELFTDELEDYNIDDTYDEVTEDVDN